MFLVTEAIVSLCLIVGHTECPIERRGATLSIVVFYCFICVYVHCHRFLLHVLIWHKVISALSEIIACFTEAYNDALNYYIKKNELSVQQKIYNIENINPQTLLCMGVDNIRVCHCSGDALWTVTVMDWSNTIFRGLLKFIIFCENLYL